MSEIKIEKTLDSLTLEEKASMTSGETRFGTQSLKRHNIPSVLLSDGPHGVRLEVTDENSLDDQHFKTVPAVCYPTAATLGASWDKDLLKEVGQSLGNDARALGVQVLLGPGVNIKRSPLCGRNFEYFSEDPYLTSRLASAYIEGVQSKKVGASLKHLVANNQEYRRNTASSEIDERALREIYLAAFEYPVKQAKPWTVMCSYNRINGVHASENEELLTKVLREQWGYEGLTISDWDAVHHRVNALKSGLDLTMPDDSKKDSLIVQGVDEGILSEETVNRSLRRILELTNQVHVSKKIEDQVDFSSSHKIAQKALEESAVLLKNNHQTLPLNNKEKVLFVGEFVERPHFQGGGSSTVKTNSLVTVKDCIENRHNIAYAKGFNINQEKVDQALEDEVLKQLKDFDKIVIFAGLPDSFESEGFDRGHMNIPKNQNHLIKEICKFHDNVLVVLHNGAPVLMPWIESVNSVLELYLGGEAVGEATMRLLYGQVNPSGKLPESFPKRLEDTPSYLSFLGSHDRVQYTESIFVGYRYYLSKKIDVLFPFGHGLSYTSFTYSNISLDKESISVDDQVVVRCDITNVGKVYGREVVQLYIHHDYDEVITPMRELKDFVKVGLEPNETKTVTFVLNKRSFAYWDIVNHDWTVEGGSYEVQIGGSSTNIALKAGLSITPELSRTNLKITELSVISDVEKTTKGKAFLDKIMPHVYEALKQYTQASENSIKPFDQKYVKKFGLASQPMYILKRFLPHFGEEDWAALYKELNEK